MTDSFSHPPFYCSHMIELEENVENEMVHHSLNKDSNMHRKRILQLENNIPLSVVFSV